MNKHSICIRMGAAHWDATILGPKPVRFDFRKMPYAHKRRWYEEFMAAVRRTMRRGRGR